MINGQVYELDNDSSDEGTNPDNFGLDGDNTSSDNGEEDEDEDDTGSDDDDDNWSYPEEEESTDDELISDPEYDNSKDRISNLLSDMYLHSSPRTQLAITLKNNLSEASKQLLLWRLDKDESFSDWTIEVSVTNKRNGKKTYHVHKTSLGLGPKKSEYFEALLTSGQFSESSNSTSEVELHEDTAKYFDVFLDYMYTHPSECAYLINRDNRSALQYLAKYFLVHKLTEDILNFIRHDMQDLKNMEEYLIEFGCEDTVDEIAKEVLAFAAQECVTSIFNIQVGSSLNYTLTPSILLYMISTARAKKDEWDGQRYHICCLATAYVKYHLTRLDVNYFHALTSDFYFPCDTSSAGTVAIELLEIIELADWERDTGRLQGICTDILCRFLADTECSFDKIDNIAKKVPKTVMSNLLTNALVAKKSHTVESINVICKLEPCTYYQRLNSGRGVVKIDIKTTDSINYVQYLIHRELLDMSYIMPYGIVGERLMLFCEGEELIDDQLVMNTPITSETVLTVRARNWT